MVRLLFFGRLGDVAGVSEIDVAPPAEVTSLDALRSWLGHGNPALAEALAHPSVKVAVDGTLVHADEGVSNASEIAFLPPVSGG